MLRVLSLSCPDRRCGSWPDDAWGAPKRGGILSFAAVAETAAYDCHASQTFALLHPVTPQYSLLVRWDATEKSKIVGDLAKSWTIAAGWPDLHFHAPRRRQVPRRFAADVGRHQGDLRAHRNIRPRG